MDTTSYQISPAVSVIMPVYNGARTLQDAIDSVLMQTFNNFELVICNDASTDETASILENVKDKRVHVILNRSNLGEGAARDRAIEAAQGRWLAVIDADDVWAPERLETLVAETGSTNNAMVFDDIIECHDTPDGMIPWRVLRGKIAFGGNGVETVEVSIDNFVKQERLLIKPILPAALVRKYRIFHSSRRFAADTEYFLQLLACGGSLYYVPKPMYYYRITPGSMSGLHNRSTMMREVLESAIEQFGNRPEVQTALQEKISLVTRDEQYMPFVWELRRMHLRAAFKIACRSPWVVFDFFRRLELSIKYHLHRIRHGGKSRGVR